MRDWVMWISFSLPVLIAAGGCLDSDAAQKPAANPPATGVLPERALVNKYCLNCHDSETKTAGLALDAISREDVTNNTRIWEKVVKKLRSRQMPPADSPRPDERTYDAVLSSLEGVLDSAAAAHPNPGRTDTLRRLNRTEYQNAIRDLLALNVDAAAWLPADESSHGFDNVTVGNLSPTLLDRYVSAGEKISRLAVGGTIPSPGGDTIMLPPDLTQEQRFANLPTGLRGGTSVNYNFPVDAEYEIQLRLVRDSRERVAGLNEPHELQLLLDKERVKSFTITPPTGED